jgi:uncharacterized protein with von Willebrand factor type A (vWA) domain
MAEEEVEKVKAKRKLTLAAALKAEKVQEMGDRDFSRLLAEIPMLEDQVRRKRNEWMEARDARLKAQWFRRGWMARDGGGE